MQSLPADVDEISEQIAGHQPGKVVVHFHGGLVSEAGGLRVARTILPTYRDAGAYALTVVWEVGLLETITRNLDSLNQTRLFNKLVDYAIRHAAKWLGADVGAKGTGSLMPLTEVEAARRSDAELEQLDMRARGAGEVLEDADVDAVQGELELEIQADLEMDPDLGGAFGAGEATLIALDPKLHQEFGADGQRGLIEAVAAARIIARIVSRVLRRYVHKRDHGVIPTVVEEVMREAYMADAGAWVWTGMKRAGSDMFEANDGAITENSHAGSYLLAKLARLQKNRPDLVIDLVGHSAGSIAIAHMLDAAAERHPDLRFRNLVLLAPAASARLFMDSIASNESRYRSFRMFTMQDDLERRNRLVPGVYPRSLLYFISGVLDGEPDAPIVGLRRHTTGTPPYDEPPLADVHAFLDASPHRFVLSRTLPSAEPGLQSTSARHTDFDEDGPTLESLQAIVSDS